MKFLLHVMYTLRKQQSQGANTVHLSDSSYFDDVVFTSNIVCDLNFHLADVSNEFMKKKIPKKKFAEIFFSKIFNFLYLSIKFFIWLWAYTEFRSVHKQKESYQYNHIHFDMKGNVNQFLWEGWLKWLLLCLDNSWYLLLHLFLCCRHTFVRGIIRRAQSLLLLCLSDC